MPKFDAEISAAIPDMVGNRDKNLSDPQQQLGAGITAVNKIMDILLCKTDDTKQALNITAMAAASYVTFIRRPLRVV